MGLKALFSRWRQESQERKERWRHELAVERGEEEETLEEMIERYKNIEEKGIREKEVDLFDLNGNGWLDYFEFDDDKKDFFHM